MKDGILEEFLQKISYERLHNNFVYKNDIIQLYKEVLDSFSLNYSDYRKHISSFLASLEKNNTHAISYSVNLFFELYEEIIITNTFNPFDLSILNHRITEDTLSKMHYVLEKGVAANNQLRISEAEFDVSSLSTDEKKEIASFIIKSFNYKSESLVWSKDMVEIAMMNTVFLRRILISLDNPELFYYVTLILFDRLYSSEYYQAGRDIAEEIILSSYHDGFQELGYFNSFRLYSSVGSIHASLLYANLSMVCILNKKPPYSEKYVKEVIWQGIKLFRNTNLYPFGIKLYNNYPKTLKFLDYEIRSLDHTYFTLLLHINDPSLPYTLLEYLQKERENILSEGTSEALPWLLTLYNVRRLYPKADFSRNGLGFFLSTFEMMVPNENVKKFKDIIDANSDDLKGHLKESLIKLNETRSSNDFVYDNENAIKISSRLLPYSTEVKDVSAFLLAMMLKSDYSILFQPKKSKELSALLLPDNDINKYYSLYDDRNAFLTSFPSSESIAVIWLGFSEGKLYQLDMFSNQFTFYTLDKWNYYIFKSLIDNDYFLDFTFSDTVKDSSGVRVVSQEEFKNEEAQILKQLEFTQIVLQNDTKELYIVKDMEISNFPHNLFIDQNNKFIAKDIPSTNILSTEWLLHTHLLHKLPRNYTKSIWIPIQNGDFPLNYLYSNIEETLRDHSFNVFDDITLTNALSSDINIICSHGANNISDVQIVSQEDNITYDLNSVVGKGTILIFFVCYSGSMKTEFYRNKISSLVNRFILQGYGAVIAPFWALDVTIPRYWLPEFLESLNLGYSISQSVFNANKKVYEQYPTPAAWACLHLYGNPLLKITD